MSSELGLTECEPLFSFAVITDTHLSADSEFAEGGDDATAKMVGLYRETIGRINEMDPAFVVHLGDMADPVPVSDKYPASAEFFKSISARFNMPMHVVPGNHDIGEKIHKALPKVDGKVSINNTTIAQYERTYGLHYYSFEHDACLCLVINTLLVNSGLPQEAAQWDWLTKTLNGNLGKRIFVFTHYPMFLSDRYEPDFYDSLEEPGRTKLLELLTGAKVEGYFAGHVHNFFFDLINGIQHTVLPSACILRTDYMELFQSCPPRIMGSFDPAKLGFLWVDVYADNHISRIVRSDDPLPYRTNPKKDSGATVTLDLRLPWCETRDIPCAWGLEIFERKEIRNDYPLAALWEMGVNDFRIPISDLLDPKTSQRIKKLATLGHRFTVVSFGVPTDRRANALIEHAEGVRALEVVALLDQWVGYTPQLNDLKSNADIEVYFNAVRPEVEGWTSHHGLHTDQDGEIATALQTKELKGVVDGFVFGIRRDVMPLDGCDAVLACLSDTSFKAQLHVPTVGMFWSTKHNDTLAESVEVARLAEAALVARAHPKTTVVADNFVELERGYVGCHGLVDRFYNPKSGSRVLTSLNALLPSAIRDLRSFNLTQARVIVGASDQGGFLLICDRPPSASNQSSDVLWNNVLLAETKCVSLDTGVSVCTTIREALDRFSQPDCAKQPVLCLFSTGLPHLGKSPAQKTETQSELKN